MSDTEDLSLNFEEPEDYYQPAPEPTWRAYTRKNGDVGNLALYTCDELRPPPICMDETTLLMI